MDLRGVLAALRAAWWFPVAGLLMGGVAALLASILQTPLYTSTTQLFVSTTNSASPSDVFQGGQFSQQRVASYVELIQGEELAQRVIDQLDLDISPQDLTEEIAASASSETVLIDVTVTDPAPAQARRIAQVVGSEFITFVTELETPPGGSSSPVKVTVSQAPEVAEAPVSPQPGRNAALGLLAGALVGAAMAIVRRLMDRSVKAADEAADMSGAPVIGIVLQDDSLAKQHVIDRRTTNRTAEDYRQLRTNLQFLNVDEPPKVIMITSAVPSEGKTTAVVNLALALAESGRSVTVVEADLRRPKVTRYLGMVGGVGLSNILAGSADVDDVRQRYGNAQFYVIAAGPTPPNPAELLASTHMSGLLDKLRAENDFVLVDAPPLLPVADSTGLAVMMDGVLLSVRYGSTRKDQLQQAAAALTRVGARTLGIILNIVPPKAEIATAYGHGYSYGYDADQRSSD
ncbi:polysaccharide biosynthesis tyrosine autokinase [Geodermatophilus sp. SYSU D00700]